jgi:hypothetical protein
MAGVRSGVIAAVASLCAACGARSELLSAGRLADASADAPVVDAGADARPYACSVAREDGCLGWSLGAPTTLSFALATDAKLRELAGDCTGAWLLADATSIGAAQPVTVIARLDLQGRVIDERVSVAVPALSATLAVDFVTQRAALFGAGSAGYVFRRLDAAEFPNGAFVPLTPTSGFSLAGASNGAASPTGFSFFAEEVRALWGLERLGVELDGSFRDRLVLGVPEEIGLGASPTYSRVAYDGGGYTVLWVDRRAGTRHALGYDEAERPSGPQTLRVANDASYVLGAVATAAPVVGFVDAHREGHESESALLDFHDRSGAAHFRQVRRPSGFASTLQGYSMAFTRGTLLTANEGGSGVPRIELLTYDYERDTFTPAGGQPMTRPMSTSRMTAAGRGAIVVWDDASGTLQSAPIECP